LSEVCDCLHDPADLVALWCALPRDRRREWTPAPRRDGSDLALAWRLAPFVAFGEALAADLLRRCVRFDTPSEASLRWLRDLRRVAGEAAAGATTTRSKTSVTRRQAAILASWTVRNVTSRHVPGSRYAEVLHLVAPDGNLDAVLCMRVHRRADGDLLGVGPLNSIVHVSGDARSERRVEERYLSTGNVYTLEGESGSERYVRCECGDGTSIEFSGERRNERKVRQTTTRGSICHFKGKPERMVRIDIPRRRFVVNLSGARGEERITKIVFADGTIVLYSGSRGNERWSSVLPGTPGARCWVRQSSDPDGATRACPAYKLRHRTRSLGPIHDLKSWLASAGLDREGGWFSL
jgi:hypothetical protein